MNAFRFFPIFSVFVFVSCLETADPEVCGNYINTNQITVVSVISTTRINGVKAYTDSSILCESISELLFRKNKDEQFYHYSYNEEEINPEHEDWFIKQGCNIIHNADMEKKVFLQILKDNELDLLNLDGLLIGKTLVFAISEQDTAWLFSYKTSLLIDDNPDYNFSISSRLGCRDGYCFVSLPITEKELCFDR